MKKVYWLVSSFVLISLLFAACAQKPQSHLEKIKQGGVIKVGTSADYPPLNTWTRAATKPVLTSS